MDDAIAVDSATPWNISGYFPSLVPDTVARDESRGLWYVSDAMVRYVELVCIVVMSGALGLLGIVTNIINLIVFMRLGFRETINISLFAMSISDLGASVLLIWITLCFNPILLNADVNVIFSHLYFYTGMWPRLMFMVVTSFLTVFISVERYLCIVFPLKVKLIMTRRTTASIIVAIFVIVVGTMVQNFFVFRFHWWWVESKNKSMLGLYYFRNYLAIERVSQQIQTFYVLFPYAAVSVCTALFAWTLNRRSKWRQAVSGGKDKATSSVRDRQIIKMVTCVAVIFIVCYFPNVLLPVLMIVSPQIDIGLKYENFFVLMFSLMTSIGAINSSVNLFVYYSMMSKYRLAFRSLFLKA